MTTHTLRVRQCDRESGQILVLAALSMVALLGISALTLDTSFMFAKRNQLHAAADGAAKSAAIEIIRNPGIAQAGLEAFADQQVAAQGFVSTRLGGTTSVVVNRPPASGPFAGNASYVEAIVSENTSTFFGNILGFASMTPLARAVAGAGAPANCLIVNEDLTFGNTKLTMNGCGVAVGGDLIPFNNNSEIKGIPTPSVGVTGICSPDKSGSCTPMGNLTTDAPTPVDPLAGLALPPAPDPSTCIAGVAATLNPGCYISIAATVTTLNPGNYYITGPVNIGGDPNTGLTGTNVMLFLTGDGQLVATNNEKLTLTAPTSGPYTGIAIFQDPANSKNIDIKNGLTISLSGALYMPSVDVDIKNSLSFTATNCTLVIVKSLYIKNGNSAFSNSGCAAAYGGAAYLNASIAQ